MSVYIDTMQPCMTNSKWRHETVCHLMADSLEELHEFADSIGLKRSWFQSSARFPHYDLTEGKRNIAVKKGAIEKHPVELLTYFKMKHED